MKSVGFVLFLHKLNKRREGFEQKFFFLNVNTSKSDFYNSDHHLVPAARFLINN